MDSPNKHTLSPVYVGGSVIGMKFREGIIIACDTRINYGSIAKMMNVNERCSQINDRTLISSTGEYSDYQEVCRLLKERAQEDSLGAESYLGPDELANYLSSMHYNRRNKANPFWNNTIIGGLDWENKPTLHSIDQFGTLLKGDYLLAGMAQYFCHAIIHPLYPTNYETLERNSAMFMIEDCFRTLFYRDTKAGNKIKFGIMTTVNGEPHYEEVIRELSSEWNYERFLNQANEKIYLEN